jgi:hypothetical protein
MRKSAGGAAGVVHTMQGEQQERAGLSNAGNAAPTAGGAKTLQRSAVTGGPAAPDDGSVGHMAAYELAGQCIVPTAQFRRWTEPLSWCGTCTRQALTICEKPLS